MRFLTYPIILVLFAANSPEVRADGPPADGARFFENQVEPILKAHCLSCHGDAKKVKGGLRLTSRAEVLKGGDSGPAVSTEQPDASLLLRAVRYQEPKMPPKGKLPQAQVDLLTRWVNMGAPWSA